MIRRRMEKVRLDLEVVYNIGRRWPGNGEPELDRRGAVTIPTRKMINELASATCIDSNPLRRAWGEIHTFKE